MITSKADYSGEHTMPLTINVSAPATGLSSYTICGSNNSRVASHLQLLDLSNGTGLQLAIVSTQSQPDLVRLGYDSGNLTIDLCLTDNGFNKTSMYNSSLYTSLHTASARHTIILPLEEVLSSCTLPTVPRNGQVSARWLLYNESLNFTCNDGYYLTGPANVTCLDDGNVTDSARTDCLPVNCTRPSTPKNGQLSQSPLNYEQPLTISCNTGYRLTGPSSVRCLANSASTGSSMTFCVAVNCTPPSAPENAKISEGPFNFEQPLIISCNSGYGLTGPSSVRCLANGTSTNSSKSSCVDMDECRLPAPVCHSKGATCTNTIGNFSCTCSFGYSGDGFVCEEIDNCLPTSCDSRANCSSNIGGFTCQCYPGYCGNGLPGMCDNVNECVTLTPCSPAANCSDTIGSYQCVCQSGFTGDGLHCQDIDECFLGVHTCQTIATCANQPGSFQCQCPLGYQASGQHRCEDINECDERMCDADADCTNTAGSYACKCWSGFTGNGSYGHCEYLPTTSSASADDSITVSILVGTAFASFVFGAVFFCLLSAMILRWSKQDRVTRPVRKPFIDPNLAFDDVELTQADMLAHTGSILGANEPGHLNSFHRRTEEVLY
eukprot:scpid46215/ scgid1521/ Fibrillin-3